MNDSITLAYGDAERIGWLQTAHEADLDALEFGVIGIDDRTSVRRSHRGLERSVARP